ncbi:MAG: hypothetical protein HGB12_02640 [Bacteroidetes bacterium]|nr:hypothetical protein [Bacteroidota bacterium]
MTFIKVKAQITATREELNKEFLFEMFGFIPEMEVDVILNTQLQFPLFYEIISPNGTIYTINSKYIKFATSKESETNKFLHYGILI